MFTLGAVEWHISSVNSFSRPLSVSSKEPAANDGLSSDSLWGGKAGGGLRAVVSFPSVAIADPPKASEVFLK
jgi:hypothetical protein